MVDFLSTLLLATFAILFLVGIFRLLYEISFLACRTVNNLFGLEDPVVRKQTPYQAIELQYDLLGSRIKQIGNIEVHYDMCGFRVKSVGDSLYSMYQENISSFRPKRLLGFEIYYDWMGLRPRWLGALEIKYDFFGTRIRQIGDAVVRYDMFGFRPRSIGDMIIRYDTLGRRPKYIFRNYPKTSKLTKQELSVIFFVLYLFPRIRPVSW